MGYALQSSINYGTGSGAPVLGDVVNLQTIAASKPYRWISGYIGRKEAIPRDLITQEPYLLVDPAHPVTMTIPSNLAGRAAVDFSSSLFCGLKNSGGLLPSFRSFSVLCRFQMMGPGNIAAAPGVIVQHLNSDGVGIGFTLEQSSHLYRFRVLSPELVQIATPGSVDVPTGTIVALAATFENTTKLANIYLNDMTAPAGTSRVLTNNSLVPTSDGGANIYIGAPYVTANWAMPMAIADLILWDRALSAAELTTVNAATLGLSGL